ncbi:MAG TPA: thioredoxin family protein [Acidobacteriaceae bacterium]|nr:thioredoxin family protein [Acidobacteriaceae bacterium]
MSVTHRVVSQQEWLEARKALLLREKEMTHLRDAVNRERLALPWVRVDTEYLFDTPDGPKTLAELFDGRSQLILYHFMLGPGWDAGCPGCSFMSDHIDGSLVHLNHHDVTYVAVSRAPLREIQSYQKRMGWSFPWVSSNQSSFNFDYGVSFTPEQVSNGEAIYNYEPSPARVINDDMELPGMSAFFKDEDGQVYHTYSSYARGGEEWIGTLMILDCAPLGRNEQSTMDFVQRHDEYEDAPKAACCH